MILDLELKWSDESGNKYHYKYGTEILTVRNKKKVYKSVLKPINEILELKQTVRDQLNSIMKAK